jgi:hypothetical protein
VTGRLCLAFDFIALTNEPLKLGIRIFVWRQIMKISTDFA